MKKARTNKTIESFIVIILMVVVLAAMVILMNSGRIAYSRIIDNADSLSDARTALSYINMKVRQNDAEGSIDYAEDVFDDLDALVIKHSGAEEGMTTYIFYDGDALREVYVIEGRQPDPDDGILIANLNGLEILLDKDKALLVATAYYDISGETKRMEKVIGIRSLRE